MHTKNINKKTFTVVFAGLKQYFKIKNPIPPRVKNASKHNSISRYMYLEQFNTGISQLYQKKCTYVTGKNPKCFLIIK